MPNSSKRKKAVTKAKAAKRHSRTLGGNYLKMHNGFPSMFNGNKFIRLATDKEREKLGL